MISDLTRLKCVRWPLGPGEFVAGEALPGLLSEMRRFLDTGSAGSCRWAGGERVLERAGEAAGMTFLGNFDFALDFFLVSPSDEEELEELELK